MLLLFFYIITIEAIGKATAIAGCFAGATVVVATFEQFIRKKYTNIYIVDGDNATLQPPPSVSPRVRHPLTPLLLATTVAAMVGRLVVVFSNVTADSITK